MRIKANTYRLISVLLLFFCTCSAYSQSPEDQKEKANELFDKGLYREAYAAYNGVLTNFPKDRDLNFRYGVCLLLVKKQKEEAIKRLLYAVKGGEIDPRAYYYLGKAYHLNYQFVSATSQYNTFDKNASKGLRKDLPIAADIKACGHGRKLLSEISDIVVLSKTEIGIDNFYNLYSEGDMGGSILRYSDFQSKEDEKRDHRPLIFFPKNSPKIYYSSYGEDGATGLDIWEKTKLPGGVFSNGQKVIGSVNTDLDEDFPYMHPDGQYLYFSSKGHNSMGGYDVFKSKYNSGINAFELPDNMDFAVSSPDDDMFYVVDGANKVAFFASSRESEEGKVMVYKVRVQRIPMQTAIVRGQFVNTTNEENKALTIKVEGHPTKQEIGTYNTKKDGTYVVSFPRGGSYTYTMSVGGSEEVHQAIIEIPSLKEFRPLKQIITLKEDENGEEQLLVQNLFDENFEDLQAILAEIYREMSALLPNADNINLDSLDAESKRDQIFVDAGLDPFATKSDVVNAITSVIGDLDKAIVADQRNISKAYNIAQDKIDLAGEKMVELNKILDEAEKATEPDKNNLLQKAFSLKSEIEILENDAQDLIVLGKRIDESTKIKVTNAANAREIKKDFDAIDKTNKNDLVNAVTSNNAFFVENIKEKDQQQNIIEVLIDAGNVANQTEQDLSNELSALSNQRTELLEKNAGLEKDFKNTKKKKEKEEIQQQIEDNESDISMIDDQVRSKTLAYEEVLENNGTDNLAKAGATVLDPANNGDRYKQPLTTEEKSKIASKVKGNTIGSELVAVNKTLNDNGVGARKIDLFGNDETTDSYSLPQWNLAIDKEIGNLKARLAKTKSSPEREKIEAEILAYENLKRQKEEEFEVVSDASEISAVVNPEDIFPNYTARKKEISAIKDEVEKAEENVLLDRAYKIELVKEQKKLEKILDRNPGADNVKERISNTEGLITDIENEIIENEQFLAENDSRDVVTADNVLSVLDDEYENKYEEILAIDNENERNAALQNLNEDVLSSAKERINDLNEVLEADSKNNKAKEELEILTNFEKRLTDNIDEPIVKEGFDFTTMSANVTSEELLPGYDLRESNSDKITDEYLKKKSQTESYTDLQQRIRGEIIALTDMQYKYPDEKVLQKRLDNLKKMDDDYSGRIKSNKEWFGENQPNEVVYNNADIVNSIADNYLEEITTLNSITDENQRTEEIESLNTRTLAVVENRIAELGQIIQSNPSNIAAKDELEGLRFVKNNIQNDPSVLLVEPLDVSNINTKPTVDEIAPSYLPRRNSIASSAQPLNIINKDLINLNNEFINIVDGEIKALEKLAVENPKEAKNIQKRITALNTEKESKKTENVLLKEDIESYLAATEGESSTSDNSNLVDENTDPRDENDDSVNENNESTTTTDVDVVNTRPSISIGAITPDYQTKIASIEKSSGDAVSKLIQKNEAHTDLIVALDTKLSSLRSEKTEHPDLALIIDGEIEQLEKIKQNKELEIKRNKSLIKKSISESGGKDTESAEALTDSGISSEDLIVENMPEYPSRLAKIESSENDRVSKAYDKIDLNLELLEKINAEISLLKEQKQNEPENSLKIDAQIKNLAGLKAEKENENEEYNEIVNNLDLFGRPEITASTLMPNYASELSEIDQSSEIEANKLANENRLHKELIDIIDLKISELETEWNNTPGDGPAIQEEIKALKDLKEEKNAEIATNESRLSAVIATNEVTSVTDLTENDFKNQSNKDAFADLQPNFDDLAGIDSEIKELKEEKENATSDKEIAKIDQKIKKEEFKRARIENEILTELGSVNIKEIMTQKTAGDVNSSIANTSNPDSKEIQKANDLMNQSDQKMSNASDSRAQADVTKDPLVANGLLNEAFILEEEAKKMVKEANTAYKTALAVDDLNEDNGPDIVTYVDPDNLKSDELNDRADELESIAGDFYDEARVVRDSAEIEKEKNRAPILARADAIEAIADKIDDKSEKIRSTANSIANQENEVLAGLPDDISEQLDSETSKSVSEMGAYKRYLSIKEDGDVNLKKAADLTAEIEALESKKKKIVKQVIGNYENSDDITESLINDSEVSEVQEQINALKTEQNEYKKKALKSYKAANNSIAGLSKTEQNNIKSAANQGIKFTEKVELAVSDTATNNTDTATNNTDTATNNTDTATNNTDIAQTNLGNKGVGATEEVGANGFNTDSTRDDTADSNSNNQETEPTEGTNANDGNNDSENNNNNNNNNTTESTENTGVKEANTDATKDDIADSNSQETESTEDTNNDNNNTSNNEVASEEPVIEAVELTDLTQDDFNNQISKDAWQELQPNFAELEDIDSEINELQEQKENATSDKEIVKIDKKIIKEKVKRASIENKIITELGAVNADEIATEKSAGEVNSSIASISNRGSESTELANDLMNQSDQKISRANDFRAQASDTKDPIEANELLNDAFILEGEAKRMVEEANKNYKAALVIDQFNADNGPEVITQVNPDNLKSDEFNDRADDLESIADNYYDEAFLLRDSAEEEKEKNKNSILAKADALEAKADAINLKSEDLRSIANSIANQENEVLTGLPDDINNELDSKTSKSVSEMGAYKRYLSNKEEGDANLKKAIDLTAEIEALEKKKRRVIKQAIVRYENSDDLTESLKNDSEVRAIQEQINTLKAEQLEYKKEAFGNYRGANNAIAGLSNTEKNNIKSAANQGIEPTEKVVPPVVDIEQVASNNEGDLANAVSADSESTQETNIEAIDNSESTNAQQEFPVEVADPVRNETNNNSVNETVDFIPPTKVTGTIFRKTTRAVYSDAKPIPVDAGATNGLVYKVQVGAFRKPLPQDYFGQFAPISGEKIRDGITRFMVGYFDNYSAVNSAKGQINGDGYPDAFIVAYCNGERISIGKARKIEQGIEQCDGTTTDLVVTNNETSSNSSTNQIENQGNTGQENDNGGNTTPTLTSNSNEAVSVTPTSTEEQSASSYYTKVRGVAKANQVEIMKGLFFTVQIGVYSKPVPNSALFNIQPLNSQLTSTNKIRYTTGVFANVDNAVVRKNQIIQIGITDAFVTAYYNGQRITVSEANRLLNDKGEGILFNGTDEPGAFTEQKTANTNVNTENTAIQENADNTETSTATVNDNSKDIEVGNTDPINNDKDEIPNNTYRIELGSFNGNVPSSFTERLLNNQDAGVLTISDLQDNITYYVGDFESLETLNNKIKDLKLRGFKDQKIITFEPEIVETELSTYDRGGLYYRVLVGNYSDNIPGEYATLLLQTDNLFETEEDIDGNVYLYSTKLEDMSLVEERIREYADFGIENMQIISYYKYDVISFDEATSIENEEPLEELNYFEEITGISADSILYEVSAVYYKVLVGRFEAEVPTDFANTLFANIDENIQREETFEGEIIFYSESSVDFNEISEIRDRLIANGFEDAKLVAFHKYAEISVDKARQLLGQ